MQIDPERIIMEQRGLLDVFERYQKHVVRFYEIERKVQNIFESRESLITELIEESQKGDL